jgi:hypothetical protein
MDEKARLAFGSVLILWNSLVEFRRAAAQATERFREFNDALKEARAVIVRSGQIMMYCNLRVAGFPHWLARAFVWMASERMLFKVALKEGEDGGNGHN